jgi:quinol monooxygenase YgiN
MALGVALAAAFAVGCAAGADRRDASAAAKLRHVVLFKFKDGATKEQVRDVEERFGRLKAQIPGILAYEWGTNVSPEKLDQGFTHCFFVTFPDAAARDAYLPHPAHKAFVEVLKPHLEKALVVDYVVKE